MSSIDEGKFTRSEQSGSSSSCTNSNVTPAVDTAIEPKWALADTVYVLQPSGVPV